MSANHHQIDLSGEHIELGSAAGRLSGVGYAVGVLGLVGTALLAASGGEASWHRAMLSYLHSFVYFLSIMLGALFFVLIQHVTQAGWSVAVRRLAEGFAANGILMAALSLVIVVPVLTGRDVLFEWTNPEIVAGDALLAGKAAYLNKGFFAIRMLIYFVAWILLGQWFFRTSVKQDETGDPNLTVKMQARSAPALFVFALTLTFAAFDLIMSLEPRWFSTMWGVYYFSGGTLAFLATLPIVSFLLQRSGRLTRLINIEHYHDMGKLVFAFVVFWTYIAFSQYMLYWYANIPEETEWFLRRQTGAWTNWSWLLLIGHFLVPFLLLISRTPKRTPGVLSLAAVWVLVMHWVDMYYLVMPHASPEVVPLSLVDVTAFLGIGGLFVGAFATRLRNVALVPTRDPRLPESLAFENF